MRAFLVFCAFMIALVTGPTGIGEAAESRTCTADRLPTDVSDILVMQARAIFGVLPQRMPGSDLDTPAQVALGRMLYFEPNLSINRTQSCNSCHPIDNRSSGADNLTTSPGALGILGTTKRAHGPERRLSDLAVLGRPRSKPRGAGKGADPQFHRDGHAACRRLPQADETIRQPIKPRFGPPYPGQAEPITYDNLAHAIAAFERTLISRGRFDQFLEGDADALTAREKEGLKSLHERRVHPVPQWTARGRHAVSEGRHLPCLPE